jgi:carbon monoxide dehydrogenase subunit G
MLISGKFTLEAPIQQVWDMLLKPEIVASCMPGCEELKAIDEKNFMATVKQKVGPISAIFRFTTTLEETNPPTYAKSVGKGEELNKAGTITHETTINLKETLPGEVEVSYESKVRIVGRLATFGDRIMRAKAKEVEEEFTKALKKKLLEQKGESY